jgi:hypothetical protein
MTQKGKEPAQAARMRLLRAALGHQTQTAMAVWLDVEIARWNNVERGYPVGRGLAEILVRKVPGLTFDWIYNGRPDGLPMRLFKSLEDAERAEQKRARA